MTTTPPQDSIATAAGQFRQGMRALVGGVTVVGALDSAGTPVGLTATAVTSLSSEPPSLLVCVNRQTTLAAALCAESIFSVNVLAADQSEISKAFGGQLGIHGPERFAYGDWRRAHDSGVPLLSGCRVSFECRVAHVHDWATHHVVIGSVLAIHFFKPEAKPLAYCDGAYQTVAPIAPLTARKPA